jgi:histidinol phosphatase-like enzyme (inositol monophosphatase family)
MDICKYELLCLAPLGIVRAEHRFGYYLGNEVSMPSQSLAETPLNLDEIESFVHSLAERAGGLSRRWFRSSLAVDTKLDLSPVTIADREIEAALRAQIGERFPSHGILGEEHGRERLDADLVWVIDPIDGTRSFISGWPIYGMLLALLDHGESILGVIDMPILNERWIGRRDRGTSLNGTSCHTSSCTNLADACLYTTSPDAFDKEGLQRFEAVSKLVRTRRFGGDCYSYGLLASGHIDLVVEAGLQPYDYMSLVPIIEGAGGVITDWAGQTLTIASEGKVVAAATTQLHAEALQILHV